RQQFEPSERGTLELWQGRLWYRLGNVERAQTRYRALEQEFQGEPLLADVLLSQSVLAHSQGIYDESVAKGLEALRLYEAQGNVNGQIQAHKDLGIDYLRIDDLESSLFHFEAGKALLEQSEDVFVAVVLSANMGITLQKLGDLEGAMDAYEWTYDSAVVLNQPLTQAQSLLNIGTIYSNDLGNEPQAIDYYQRSLDISQANELSYGVMLNHMNMGVSFGAMDRTDEALAAFDQAMALAVELERPNERRHLLGEKTKVLANAGRYEEAFATSQAQKEIAETLFNESRDRAIADLRVEYETELAEQALALAQARNEQQSQWIRFLWVVVALLVALVGMGGGFLLYRNRSLRELYERNVELLDQFYGAEGRQSLGEDADQDPMKGLFDRLLVMLEKEALFKDEQLSLTGLARQAQSNEKYISQAISRYANMNFANFINYYRINEAKKLLRSADDKVGITDVMLECGFSHKSTFYAAFKKFTGMTPTQFRAVAEQESSRVSPKSENIGAVAQ
ncbi:MAG TPA: helix-turn-helix domain-containing protein, partial [Wenzhouxiangella sp.]